MSIEEIAQKVGEAFLNRDVIRLSFRDNDKEPRWCLVNAVDSRQCDIEFNALLNDGLFVTALATISYKDILKVSF